jgi:hypothetical protein
MRRTTPNMSLAEGVLKDLLSGNNIDKNRLL